MKKLLLSSILLGSFLVLPQVQAAPSPLSVVKTSNTQVQNILKGKDKVDPATEQKIYHIIDAVTSWSYISRNATAMSCRKLTSAQCKKFNRTFQKLLKVSSIKKTGRYRAEGFEYKGQRFYGSTAIVKTIAIYKKDRVALNYHLKKLGGRWVIINYVVDDVDTIRNYKKQFRLMFRRKSFNDVISILENRIKRYEGEL